MFDFSKYQGESAADDIIEPRKIFNTLTKDPRFQFLSDVQGEVLGTWFPKRVRQDNIIKVNTGAGKTAIGLLALRSSLNEKVGPAVYVAPDPYLAAQVMLEARALGIAVTDSETSSEFLAGESILVINVWKLFNGRSVFGVGGELKIRLGAIVIDDAHACMATIADQFTIRVDSKHPVYAALLKMFYGSLEQQSPMRALGIEASDPWSTVPVPFWAWQNKLDEVRKLLYQYKEDDKIKWAFPLIDEVLGQCQCVFGGACLELAPRCLPIDNVTAFARASRRIYMTATLADDGDLITCFKADAAAVLDPIRPQGAGDMGERLILAPQESNPDITDEQIRDVALALSALYSVCIIVPSHRRAQFWAAVGAQVLDKDSIGEGVRQLKAGRKGLSVFVNKYDGIDLPYEACRVLIIDGLPEVTGLLERIEAKSLDGTDRQTLRQVQRIEQGMGRGVRSREDYCVVVLLGGSLSERIHRQDARRKFSPATLAQLDLSKELTKQMRGKPATALFEAFDYCLKREPNWVQANRNALARAPEGPPSSVEPYVIKLREAFELTRIGHWDRAAEAVQAAINATGDNRTKGYLKQRLAEIVHHMDPAKAQEVMRSAIALNDSVLRPLDGINYTRLKAAMAGQPTAVVNYFGKFENTNDVILHVADLLDSLQWNENGTDRFERAMQDLGHLLGFGSQRPDSETGNGPDNLWAVGGLNYFVIECKSGATRPEISRYYCNQLLGSVEWFGRSYDATCHCTPIMIYPTNRFESNTSPSSAFRIIDLEKLEQFKTAVHSFVRALVGTGIMPDAQAVAKQVNQFGLTGPGIIDRYTVGFVCE